MRGKAVAKPAKLTTLSAKIDPVNKTQLVSTVFKHPMPCGIDGFSTGC
jgi:hypothetical protein